MKTLTMTLAFLAGLPLALSAQVSKEDIKKLTGAGISDEVILSYVKANGGVARLSADDVIELKQAGASEKLLSVILGAPAPAAERMPEKTVLTRPATTYAYNSTPYYYTPTTYYDDYAYYPRSYYYPSYYYYPTYYSSSCYPRAYYYPSFSIGFSTGRWCSSRVGFGVSTYRR